MGVTVAQALAMPVLARAEPSVLAGAEALERGVRWVHSAEVADIAHLLRGGELVLTTGIALPGDAGGLIGYVRALASAGAVGLVLELGQRWTDDVPPALVEACRSETVPLISLAREVRFAEVAQAVGERIVDEHLLELRAVEQVHERFTQLSVSGAAPVEILAEVTAFAQAPVVLESFHHRVLGYDAGDSTATGLLDRWEQRSRAVRTTGRTSYDETTGWLVTVVGARGDDWGRLLLRVGERPPYRHVVLVEQAAAALALHRLHARERDSVERQTHSALLAALAAGDVSDELAARCEGAGVPLAGRVFVALAMRPRATADDPVFAADQRLAEVATTAAAAARSQQVPALVAVVDDMVQVMLSHAARRGSERVVDAIAHEVLGRSAVTIGAGAPVREAHAIHHALAEARHVVSAARDGSDGPLVHRLEDVHVRGLVHLLGNDERLGLFVERELGALLRHDARTGGRLVECLRALLAHPGNKAAAAASLHLSRPALYERLGKVEQVLGVDLDDAEVRTALHVALLAHDRA